VNTDIESKYTRKKLKQGIHKKFFKEDEQHEDSFEEIAPNDESPIFKRGKQNKEDIRNLGEFITTKRPKDPFKDLDPLTQKVDISEGLAYSGTSQNDVLFARIVKHNEEQPLEENRFLALPVHLQKKEDPDFVDDGMIRSNFNAF